MGVGCRVWGVGCIGGTREAEVSREDLTDHLTPDRYIRSRAVRDPDIRERALAEMCSGSEAGSYLRLIDFVYHPTLVLRVLKKNRPGYKTSGYKPL